MTDTTEPSAKIQVLVLDDQPLLRYGISAYLNSQAGIVVCGEADSIPGVQSKIAECQPQLLVTDLRIGGCDSLKLVKELKSKNRALRTLMYSSFEESIFAERAIRAGADGYLMKKAPKEELAAAIRDIEKGSIYVSREMALSGFRKSLQQQPKNNHSRSANALENLSDREMHVFHLLGSGLGTREIAQSLGLSAKTVESHRENIKHKLRLRSGAQLRKRAAKWVEEASGLRKSGKQRVHAFREHKHSRSGECEEPHRRDQQERPVEFTKRQQPEPDKSAF